MAIHRVDLHKELLRLALKGDVNPVSLTLSAAAVGISINDSSLELIDGTKHHADLIVGADGIHSSIRSALFGEKAGLPAASNMSAFRLLLPTSTLTANRDLTELLQWKTEGATIFADTMDKANERHLVWYPCRGYAYLSAVLDIFGTNLD